jgi:hypothetical protein
MESLASKTISTKGRSSAPVGQFVNDCHTFLLAKENWAERAAGHGWNDLELFGCCRRPLYQTRDPHLGECPSDEACQCVNTAEVARTFRDCETA